MTAPAKRALVRQTIERGVSERRELRTAWMSASTFRYVPRPGRNTALRAQILTLVHRHKRYGVSVMSRP